MNNGRRVLYALTRKGESIEGKFLSFGIDYEQLQDGVGQFSTALIEDKTGAIKNIPVDFVRFIED